MEQISFFSDSVIFASKRKRQNRKVIIDSWIDVV